MDQSIIQSISGKARKGPQSESDAVELWKYFGSVGGADKNTMVQVCNWLLGFSAAIITFAFGKSLETSILGERSSFLIMAFLGFTSSIVSSLVSLTYGGYANRNWARADQIARDYQWTISIPMIFLGPPTRKGLG